jgi:hypothetical protein
MTTELDEQERLAKERSRDWSGGEDEPMIGFESGTTSSWTAVLMVVATGG